MRRYATAIIAAAIGIVIAPVVAPTLGRLLRPVAKHGIKASIAMFESGKVAAAHLSETAADMAAEARHELSRRSNTEA
jgi:hypothetical protein